MYTGIHSRSSTSGLSSGRRRALLVILLSLSLLLLLSLYTHICVYIYIYIYMYREREREKCILIKETRTCTVARTHARAMRRQPGRLNALGSASRLCFSALLGSARLCSALLGSARLCFSPLLLASASRL